jgi:hypothetical protein
VEMWEKVHCKTHLPPMCAQVFAAGSYLTGLSSISMQISRKGVNNAIVADVPSSP